MLENGFNSNPADLRSDDMRRSLPLDVDSGSSRGHALDGAGIEIALDSNRSDINSGRSDDQSRLRESSRKNGSPGRD